MNRNYPGDKKKLSLSVVEKASLHKCAMALEQYDSPGKVFKALKLMSILNYLLLQCYSRAHKYEL